MFVRLIVNMIIIEIIIASIIITESILIIIILATLISILIVVARLSQRHGQARALSGAVGREHELRHDGRRHAVGRALHEKPGADTTRHR